MARQLRYVTYGPGELEARLRELAPPGTPILSVSQLKQGSPGTGLLKAHCCAVTYPDGKSGDCRYERLGPRWHIFGFTYEEEGLPLPRQVWMYPLDNTAGFIEAKARELASAAYREAIRREREDYFQRASEPSDGSRKKNPALYRMKAGRAKEWAGKYALCERIGQTLCAMGLVYDTLEEANAAWQAKNDRRIVVGCCCRLNRAWELPRFNPLYAVFDPRPHKPETKASVTETQANTHAGKEDTGL